MDAREFFDSKIQEQIDAARARHSEHGWEFPERREGGHTIGDFVQAVLAITDPDDACLFYEGCVSHLASQPDLTDTPEAIAKSNIGWCFGEGMGSLYVHMWREVCQATHPIFGPTQPSPEEAFAAGIEAGKAIRDGS